MMEPAADPMHDSSHFIVFAHSHTGGNHLTCTDYSKLSWNKQEVVHFEYVLSLFLI